MLNIVLGSKNGVATLKKVFYNNFFEFFDIFFYFCFKKKKCFRFFYFLIILKMLLSTLLSRGTHYTFTCVFLPASISTERVLVLAALFLAGNNDIVLSPLLFTKKIIFYFVSLSSNKDMSPQKMNWCCGSITFIRKVLLPVGTGWYTNFNSVCLHFLPI